MSAVRPSGSACAGARSRCAPASTKPATRAAASSCQAGSGAACCHRRCQGRHDHRQPSRRRLLRFRADVIKDSAKSSLDKVVLALKKQYAGKTVRIEGYTDTDPIVHSHWKSNKELSDARATAVSDYLVAHGIEGSRITTKGYGDTKPKATKALSRRVEVVVITG